MITKAPNFIVVGASRSGTTTLFEMFRLQRDVLVPKVKEICFFNKDGNFKKGIDWYHSHFLKHSKERAIGEISPPYFHRGIRLGADNSHIFSDEDSAARIAEYNKNIRIIITLRNPLDRFISQFWKNFLKDPENLSMEESVQKELKEIRTEKNSPFCFLYKNSYSVHLKHWLNKFDRKQVKILIFEEWIKKQHDTLVEVAEFLEFDYNSSQNRDNLHKNSGERYLNEIKNSLTEANQDTTLKNNLSRKKTKDNGYYPPISNIVRETLNGIFQKEITDLENLLERRLECWKVLSQ